MSNQETRFSEMIEEAKVLYGLGLLISAGTPILEAINQAASHSGRFNGVLRAAHDAIREGEVLQTSIQSSNLFFPFVAPLIGAGEETGEVDVVLLMASHLVGKMAEFYSADAVIDQAGLATAVDFYILAILINAGLPQVRSLQITGELSMQNQEAFEKITARVTGGDSVSTAMEEAGKNVLMPGGGHLSDDTYWSVILEGETEGTLDIAVKRLANTLMQNVLGIDVFPA